MTIIKALEAEYLPALPGWAMLCPAAPSTKETGAKRGSCVLLSPTFAELPLETLRNP